MNKVIIPPSANWYETSIFSCASDNTLLYGAKNHIVVVKPTEENKPLDIQLISNAHQERITCIAITPYWNETDKLAVTAGEDKIVKLWDIANCTSKIAHNSHTANIAKVVGLTFAGKDKVVSISEDGLIILWRLGANHLTCLRDLFGRVKVSVISACPHVSWLTAVGTHSGYIFIIDLRKTGKIVHKLRGHDKMVINLSWCPTPYNIFPKNLTVKFFKTRHNKKQTEDDQETNNISNVSLNSTENEGIVSDLLTYSCLPKIECSDNENIACMEHDNILPEMLANSSPPKVSDLKTKTLLQDEKSEDEIIGDSLTEVNFCINEVNNRLDDQRTLLSKISKIVDDQKLVLVEYKYLEDNCNDKAPSPSSVSDDNVVSNDEELLCKDNEEGMDAESTKAVEPACDEKVASENPVGVNDDPVSTDSPQPSSVEEEVKNVESPETVELTSDETKSENNILNMESVNENSISLVENVELAGGDDDIKVKLCENVKNDAEVSNEPVREYLLASSARSGGSIVIWRAGTDGCMQSEIVLPKKIRNRKGPPQVNRAWISVCWVQPNLLLTSSATGDLYQWTLSADRVWKSQLVHNNHSNNFICIASPLKLYSSIDEPNWRNEIANVWTTGQDRYVINTNLGEDKKTQVLFPSLGGRVLCLAVSPLDPNRIAIGCGEGSVKLWDLSLPHLKHITMTRLWHKQQNKIYCLAWHPTKEVIIAYGNMDGRIALVDTSNLSKSPMTFIPCFKTPIYNLEWGPFNGNKYVFGLYACSEGKLAIYNANNPIEEPTLLNVGNSEFISQFSWKPDYSTLAVGTKSGSVSLFTVELELMSTFYVAQKCVQCLCWHPQATAEESSVSSYHNMLAVATNDTSIVVYDCSVSDEQASGDNIIATLDGHTKAVKSLAWSPHHAARLVSVSEDSRAQVWDVAKKSLISTYCGHTERLHFVMWSPVDSDYIISVGRDNTVQVWKISENAPMLDPCVIKREHQKMINIGKEDKSKPAKEEKPKKVVRSTMFRRIIKGGDSSDSLINTCKRLLRKHESGETEDKEEEADVLQLFGDHYDMQKLLQAEQTSHKQKGRYVCYQHMALWKGDISNVIREAIDNGNVNSWLLNMAPMVSPLLWQEACEAYVRQLLDKPDSDPLEIASYYLACHKVDDAINHLCDTMFFREALAIARCRLLPSDGIFNEIYRKWAVQSTICGTFEVAAQCYIKLGEIEEAAKVLARRNDRETLMFATDLAEKCQNKDLYNGLVFRLNSLKSAETKPEDKPLPSRIELELSIKRLIHCHIQNGNSIDDGQIVEESQGVSIVDKEILMSDSLVQNGNNSPATSPEVENQVELVESVEPINLNISI